MGEATSWKFLANPLMSNNSPPAEPGLALVIGLTRGGEKSEAMGFLRLSQKTCSFCPVARIEYSGEIQSLGRNPPTLRPSC